MRDEKSFQEIILEKLYIHIKKKKIDSYLIPHTKEVTQNGSQS